MNSLKQQVKASGLKQSFIADKVGVTETYLSYVLNGKRNLTDDLKYKILLAIQGK